MDVKADELKAITRKVLGDGPGPGFYAKADRLFDEALTNSALVLATREIEKSVKLFVGVQSATVLKQKYQDFFKKNPSYV